MGIALFTLLLCIYLFFGIYVLFVNFRDRINQLFFLVCLCYALDSLGAIFIQSDLPEVNLQKWFKFSFILYHFSWYLILVYILRFTKLIKPTWYTYAGLSIPMVYLIISFLVSVPTVMLHYKKGSIRYISAFSESLSGFIIPIIAITGFYLVVSAALLLLAFKRTKLRKERSELRIMLIAQIACLILSFFDQIVLFHWTGILHSRIPGISQFYVLIWIAGIYYSMAKFRFMALTPQAISNDILSNIDEAVILLDQDERILAVNNRVKEITKTDKNLVREPISFIINEYDSMTTELRSFEGNDITSFSIRVNFKCSDGSRILMEATCKSIKDKFGDLIGFLIISKEVKELKQLQDIYRITSREASIIQSVIAGKTNHHISEEMGITERTVKSHITNIFNKLVVDNRVQLIILLKEFNLIPGKKADKILFRKQRSPFI
jgi:PAS domain S-box-containing protein